MKENSVNVTMGGKAIILLGQQARVGDVAVDFTVSDGHLKDVKLSDFKGKTVVLSVFPSIDTSVCASQARRFNKSATELGDDVVVLAISKDLPFALGRFCAAEGIDKVHTLSDYKVSDFGLKYGFLIKDLMLLARGVVVVDKSGKIAYVEYVPEVTTEPNYDAALDVVRMIK